MFVDTEWLRLGANESHRAGGHALEAAGHLSRGPLPSGMFGDFGAADMFHQAVSQSHGGHVKTLQYHHRTLTEVGDRAHQAVAEFTAMDERNAAELRMGQCNSAT
jgi:Protein of unknown function (DUF2563)